MKFWKKITAIFMAASVMMLSACGAEQNDGADGQDETAYRTEITQEEMESGFASFEMSESLTVQARITPPEKYEKGLASYYCQFFDEPAAGTVSGHDRGQWEKMLAEILPGSFEGKGFPKKKKSSCLQKYKSESGVPYVFDVIWRGNKEYYKKHTDDKGEKFFAPTIQIQREEGGEDYFSNIYIAWDIRCVVPDYQETNDLPFPIDQEKEAEKIRTFLEKASGRKICSEYDVVSYNKENTDKYYSHYSSLTEEDMAGIDEEDGLDEDWEKESCACFMFFYDIDGLPFRNTNVHYAIPVGQDCDALCYYSYNSNDSELTAVGEPMQAVVANKNGIMGMRYSNQMGAGKVFKEREAVIGPNEVLKGVNEYYEDHLNLLEGETRVTDIQLIYTGYFDKDPKTELITPIIIPAWIITVHDGTPNRSGTYQFVYDAYTGQALAIAERESSILQ